MRTKSIGIVIILSLFFCQAVVAEIKRVKFSANQQYLIVEVLDDDLLHIELSAVGAGTDITAPLYTSPMIFKTDYSGPSTFSHQNNVVETAAIKVEINTQNLCISFTDKLKNSLLSTICPADLQQVWKGLNLTKEHIENVYGLGQQFKALGSADGDWLQHRLRAEQPPGQAQSHGNGFMPFGSAGMVGNVQFPIMYALGKDNINYALLLDNVYKQRWDFQQEPWQVRMWGDQIRFYILTGPDLPDLRQDYLELVGRPPVPPRKAFGLWVSEFGYKNWQQIDKLRAGLRQDRLPVDGFVLDLQWFGGIIENSPASPMGRLDWDQDQNDGNGFYFPTPEQNISFFNQDHIGLIAIEESYVSKNSQTLAQMRAAGNYFAYAPLNQKCTPLTQEPILLTDWFGQAAMVDWSNVEAGAWLHDNKRFPNLISKGIIGHWTDLGEPEKYDGNACYQGVETTATIIKNHHGDIHNLYAFLWNKSIYDGYVRKGAGISRRPFILSRSGAPGSERFGVAMWSGDIGSHLSLLATHANAQMHMSFSGIDYYGADIGGFRREGMPYNDKHANTQYQNELYTQWLANGAWFDIPIRPHTDNSFQTSMRYETAPNLVGHIDSNRENLKQRYALTPYYYSLAYRAYLFGQPLLPPLVYYYQNDPNVRQMGHEKLVGKDLLVGVVAKHGEYARHIYLPKGQWINFHTEDWFTSGGEWIENFPTYLDGVLRLPTFARAGAIIPMMYVDDKTQDTYGHRQGSGSHNEFMVTVYADKTRSSFTLYEDDGSTLSYDATHRPRYATRTTEISQQHINNVVTLTLGKASGTYKDAPTQRDNVIRLIVDNARALNAKLNGVALTQRTSAAQFESATSGWHNSRRNVILIKTGVRTVAAQKVLSVTLQPISKTTSANFVCNNGWTALGETLYVSGSIAQLGQWNPSKALKLSPSIYYEYIYNPPPNHQGPGPNSPTWTGYINGLPGNTPIEWKCVKKRNDGTWQWQAGVNALLPPVLSGFRGSSVGSL